MNVHPDDATIIRECRVYGSTKGTVTFGPDALLRIARHVEGNYATHEDMDDFLDSVDDVIELLETRITRLTWATIASTALLVGFIIKDIIA